MDISTTSSSPKPMRSFKFKLGINYWLLSLTRSSKPIFTMNDYTDTAGDDTTIFFMMIASYHGLQHEVSRYKITPGSIMIVTICAVHTRLGGFKLAVATVLIGHGILI